MATIWGEQNSQAYRTLEREVQIRVPKFRPRLIEIVVGPSDKSCDRRALHGQVRKGRESTWASNEQGNNQSCS